MTCKTRNDILPELRPGTMKLFPDNMKCLESATVLCSNRKEEEQKRKEDSSKPEVNFFKSPHIFSGRNDVTSEKVNFKSDIRQKPFEGN